MHPPPSPPPTYEEVAKARPMLLPTSQLSSSKKSLEVVASSPSAKEYESPPEYQEAVERGSPGASCKGLAKRFGSSEADGEDERVSLDSTECTNTDAYFFCSIAHCAR